MAGKLVEPTELGKELFSPDGYYDGYPCTCDGITCQGSCDGLCGCDACHYAYMDYLCGAGDW